MAVTVTIYVNTTVIMTMAGTKTMIMTMAISKTIIMTMVATTTMTKNMTINMAKIFKKIQKDNFLAYSERRKGYENSILHFFFKK